MYHKNEPTWLKRDRFRMKEKVVGKKKKKRPYTYPLPKR